MATVRTTAGKRLLANEAMNARSFALITPEAIAAIEAEAEAAERSRATKVRVAAQAVVRTWYGQQDETWADRMHADVGVLLVTLSDTSHAGEADW